MLNAASMKSTLALWASLFVGSALHAQTATSQVAAPQTRLPEVLSSSVLNEEQRIGPTQRPEWTSRRRFTTTRVYIQRDPGEVAVEQWWRVRDFRNGTVGHLFQQEVEIGLPWRMQLDLYENWVSDDQGRSRHNDFAVELRWALADWGVIPLNPTLYGEYKFVDPGQGPDVYEFKLLLGDQLLPRLHWGLNAVFEQEVGGARTTEFQVSQGVSYSLIDSRLGVGMEMKWISESEKAARGDSVSKFLIGPSVQVRPSKNTHLDLVALFGTNQAAPSVEGYVVFGINFGKVGGHYSPTSLRSN